VYALTESRPASFPLDGSAERSAQLLVSRAIEASKRQPCVACSSGCGQPRRTDSAPALARAFADLDAIMQRAKNSPRDRRVVPHRASIARWFSIDRNRRLVKAARVPAVNLEGDVARNARSVDASFAG